MFYPKLDEDTKASVRLNYLRGVAITTIAKEFNITRQSVYNILNPAADRERKKRARLRRRLLQSKQPLGED